MTAQDQQSREEFEDWWNEFAPSGFDGGAGYEKTCAYAAWKVQADRNAAQVQAMGRVPPGFVAVPMEPTAEMVDAAEEAYMPFGDMALAIQSAIAATRPPEA